MRQLQPHGLSLFHLIILANTVHDHDPMYSLLKRQCYWFANTIYHVVACSYNCTIVQAGENIETEQIRIPPNMYLLDLAERWRGVKVSRVSETILELMKQKFKERLDKESAEVCFKQIPDKNQLNIRYR